jgi:ferric-dicitrate binding protein FerR (iron transport regulator)
MNKEQLNQALKSYLDGTATPEEMTVIDQWYAQYEKAPGYTGTLTDIEREVLRSKMLDKVLTSIVVPGQTEEQESPARRIRGKQWLKLSAAAAIAAGLILAWNWQKITGSRTHINYVANNTTHIVKQSLPDSSVVWLNPNATLSYPDAFDVSSRNVSMSGDCFFEVTKNAGRPFIIQSNQLVTKVWGTSFRVYDRHDGTIAKVTVVTGKVSVSQRNNEGVKVSPTLTNGEVILLPAQEVVYNKNNRSLQENKHADMKQVQKWAHVGMNFDNVSFPEIIKQLSTRFGVEIHIGSSQLANEKMTADLSGLNLPEVLDVLKTSMQINYTINENDVTISR